MVIIIIIIIKVSAVALTILSAESRTRGDENALL